METGCMNLHIYGAKASPLTSGRDPKLFRQMSRLERRRVLSTPSAANVPAPRMLTYKPSSLVTPVITHFHYINIIIKIKLL